MIVYVVYIRYAYSIHIIISYVNGFQFGGGDTKIGYDVIKVIIFFEKNNNC